MTGSGRVTLVPEFLERSAEQFPDKDALVVGDERLTFGEFERRASRVADALRAGGVARGDRVAIFMDGSVEAAVSVFAAMKAGGVFVFVNHGTKAAKLEYILNDCAATALLTQAARMRVVEAIDCPALHTVVVAGQSDSARTTASFEAIVADAGTARVTSPCIDRDLAALIYTSGSTGNPKGVMLSHLNMVTAADSITTYLENTAEDVILNVLPLSFDYGLYQLLMACYVGCTLVLEKSFMYPYEVMKRVEALRITGLPIVPTISAMLLELDDLAKFDLGALRYISNTAAALPGEHIRRLREAFPDTAIYSMYGLTECKRVAYLPPHLVDQKPGSVGVAMPNTEVFVVDDAGNHLGPGRDGELVVRGSHVMLGYWNLPEQTARRLKPGPLPGEMVLHTGDVFRTDEDGHLYFVGRMDDIIKSRGEKVSPREVENVLYALEGVVEAGVIGVADDTLGEAIVAFVVAREGAGLDERAVRRHCARHLEPFMVPQSIELVDALPKTDSGKVSSKGLRELKTASAP